MRRVLENPFYQKFDPARQEQNLLAAIAQHKLRPCFNGLFPPYGFAGYVDPRRIEPVWREGRLRDLWRCSLQEFNNYRLHGRLAGRHSYCRRRRKSQPWEIERAHDEHGEFRQGRGYRKNPDHVRKPQEPTNRQIWRETTGLLRDQRKTYWRSYKRHVKHYTGRKYRAWVRQNLARENYDAFHAREYNERVDPWGWD